MYPSLSYSKCCHVWHRTHCVIRGKAASAGVTKNVICNTHTVQLWLSSQFDGQVSAVCLWPLSFTRGLTNELKPAYKGLFFSPAGFSFPGDHRMHRPVCILVVQELDALRCVCQGGQKHNAVNPSSEIRNKEITENKCRKKRLINGPQVDKWTPGNLFEAKN